MASTNKDLVDNAMDVLRSVLAHSWRGSLTAAMENSLGPGYGRY